MEVLYLDNRLLTSVFKEEDMETLSHFAAMATIALDNAQACAEVKAMSQRLEEEKKYYEEQQFESADSDEIIGKSNGIKK
jgi:transcriptional regulator with GAF, ATPase, and Fis domain